MSDVRAARDQEKIRNGSRARRRRDADLAAEHIRETQAVFNLSLIHIYENGKAYRVLPRLSPFDCYYLYNPDGYYRIK